MANYQQPLFTASFDPWTPLKLPGIHTWLDGLRGRIYSDTPPEIEATNGQTIRRWDSRQSGGLNPAQSTGASQPLAANYGVTFDGVDDVLLTESTFANSGQALTLAATFRRTSTEALQRIAEFAHNGSTIEVASLHIQSVNTLVFRRSKDVSGYDLVTKPLTTSGWVVALATYGPSGLSLRVHNDAAPATFAGTSSPTGTHFSVGASPRDTAFFGGTIGDVVVCSGVLNADNQKRLGQFLARRAGVGWKV